jgi:hypothetical protein
MCANNPKGSGGRYQRNLEVVYGVRSTRVCERTLGKQNAIYPSKERNLNPLRPGHRSPVGQNENEQESLAIYMTTKARS